MTTPPPPFHCTLESIHDQHEWIEGSTQFRYWCYGVTHYNGGILAPLIVTSSEVTPEGIKANLSFGPGMTDELYNDLFVFPMITAQRGGIQYSIPTPEEALAAARRREQDARQQRRQRIVDALLLRPWRVRRARRLLDLGEDYQEY